jgi:hypothetical protein
VAQKFTTPIVIRNITSAASDALAVSVDGEAADRIKFEAGGRLVWGGGASAGDVNLYRHAADLLKTDDAFEAAAGVITLTSSGTPTSSIADGAIAIDTTNDVFYFKSSGTWQEVAGGGATVTVSDTAPASPVEGDLWFESDTGRLLVYYDSTWVEVGGAGGGGGSSTITSSSTDAAILLMEIGP